MNECTLDPLCYSPPSDTDVVARPPARLIGVDSIISKAGRRLHAVSTATCLCFIPSIRRAADVRLYHCVSADDALATGQKHARA